MHSPVKVKVRDIQRSGFFLSSVCVCAVTLGSSVDREFAFDETHCAAAFVLFVFVCESRYRYSYGFFYICEAVACLLFFISLSHHFLFLQAKADVITNRL